MYRIRPFSYGVHRVLLAASVLPCAFAAGQAGTTGENIIPNGDFSKGNVGFTSALPYTKPERNCLWPSSYTIAPRFDNPQLHLLIENAPFYSAVKRTGKEQVFFANAGGRDPVMVWSTNVKVKPKTQYLISFNCISLSGHEDNGNPPRQIPTMEWVPDFFIEANGQQSPPSAAGLGQYYKVRMTWNSGSATTATIKIVRDRIEHGGGLIGISNIEMVQFK